MTTRCEQIDALLPPLDALAPVLAFVPTVPVGALPTDLPGFLADRLREAPGDDRSGQSHAFIGACVEMGYDDTQVVALALRHPPTTAKYGTRAHVEVERTLGKLRSQHPHPGRSCTKAECPGAPAWMARQAAKREVERRPALLTRNFKAGPPPLDPTEPWPTEAPPGLGDGPAGLPPGIDPATGEIVGGDLSPTLLPEEFWIARPALAHIRTAARSRMIAPDALLGAVLARVCLNTDHRIVLPAIVGRTGTLNVTVGIAGPSGAGKGSVADESQSLIGTPALAADYHTGDAPAGSGEGMVAAFFDERPDPDDKRRRLLVQVRQGMLIRVDEGETLRTLGDRKGQSTWTVLRQAFSAEALGDSYVSAPGRRLPAHGYRLALLMAIQPELAHFIFADVAGGTPQRFLWFAATDPGAPPVCDLPAHPGPLCWAAPRFDDPAVQDRATIGPHGRRWVEMGVAPAIVTEVRRHRHVALTGEEQDPMEAHGDLVRLKVAGLLAVLDGRTDLGLDDWRLAGTVAGTSRATREWMQARITAESHRRDHTSNERAAARAARVETAKAAATAGVDRIARVIRRHVHKHGADDPEGCNRRCLSRSVRSTDRDQLDAALGLAVRDGSVVEVAGRYSPGESTPS